VRNVTVPTAEDLAAARAVVAQHLAPTPVVESPALGAWLKLESAQPIGAFKARGALAGLARLPPGIAVVAASTGNHALGVAWAARRLGVAARIVIPETTSPAKLAKLRALRADLVVHGGDYDGAEQHALSLDGHYLSPCNDTGVIAGQSTVGAELGEQFDGPLGVVVPIGGGGLIGGIVLWAQGRPATRVVGVQAEASPTMLRAVEAGAAVPVDAHPTIADGVTGSVEPGSVTIGLAARAEAIVLVSEAEIRDGMRFLAAEHGLVVEGAGAVPVAAIRAGRVRAQPGERLVAVVTGRNIALDAYAAALAA
jgi:threonine dehydratase